MNDPHVLNQITRDHLRDCLNLIPHAPGSALSEWLAADTLDTDDLERIVFNIRKRMNEMRREAEQTQGKVRELDGSYDQLRRSFYAVRSTLEKADRVGATSSQRDLVEWIQNLAQRATEGAAAHRVVSEASHAISELAREHSVLEERTDPLAQRIRDLVHEVNHCDGEEARTFDESFQAIQDLADIYGLPRPDGSLADRIRALVTEAARDQSEEHCADTMRRISDVVDRLNPGGSAGSLAFRVEEMAGHVELERAVSAWRQERLNDLYGPMKSVRLDGESPSDTMKRLVRSAEALGELNTLRDFSSRVREVLSRVRGRQVASEDVVAEIEKLAFLEKEAADEVSSAHDQLDRLVEWYDTADFRGPLPDRVWVAGTALAGKATVAPGQGGDILERISKALPVPGAADPEDLLSRVRRTAEEHAHFRVQAELTKDYRDALTEVFRLVNQGQASYTPDEVPGMVTKWLERREEEGATQRKHAMELRARLGERAAQLTDIARSAGWVPPEWDSNEFEDEPAPPSAAEVAALVRALAKRAHVAERDLSRARKGRSKGNKKKEEIRAELEFLRGIEAELLVILGQPGLAPEDIPDAVRALRELARFSSGKDAAPFVRRTPRTGQLRKLARRMRSNAVIVPPVFRPEERPALREQVAVEPGAAEFIHRRAALVEHCQAGDWRAERVAATLADGSQVFRRVYRVDSPPPEHVRAVRALDSGGEPDERLFVRFGESWSSDDGGARVLTSWVGLISRAQCRAGYALVFDCTHELGVHYEVRPVPYPEGERTAVFALCSTVPAVEPRADEPPSVALDRAVAAARVTRAILMVTQSDGPEN